MTAPPSKRRRSEGDMAFPKNSVSVPSPKHSLPTYGVSSSHEFPGIKASDFSKVHLGDQNYFLVGHEGYMGHLKSQEAERQNQWWSALKQVWFEDENAGKLFKFLAYFERRNVTFELLKAGRHWFSSWMCHVLQTRAHFQSAMLKLEYFHLVQRFEHGWQVDPLIHSWNMTVVNKEPDITSLADALACLAGSITHDSDQRSEHWYQDQKLVEHAKHLCLEHFKKLWRAISGKEEQPDKGQLDLQEVLVDLDNIASLCRKHKEFRVAKKLYETAMKGRRALLSDKHVDTLHAANKLGNAYADLNRYKKAEKYYNLALEGRKELGPAFVVQTFDTMHNLGELYADWRKPGQAEENYTTALSGYLKLAESGADQTLPCDTFHNLGRLYHDMGKRETSIEMFEAALTRKKAAWGWHHSSTLDTAYQLASVFEEDGQLESAEEMYKNAAAGYCEVYGRHERTTEDAIDELLRCTSKIQKRDAGSN